MKKIFIISALLLVSACAGSRSFDADVTRFHRFENTEIGGQSVAVEPADPAHAGLEFSSYANLIGEKLRQQGYFPSADGTPSELLALVGYSSQKRDQIEPDRSPVSVGVGVGGGSGGVGVGLGTMFGMGKSKPKASYLYTLSMQLKNRRGGEVIFEGRAISESEIDDISVIMPYLIDALFADFPGSSGTSETYSTKMDSKN